MNNYIVIDGFSASGKSTLAKEIVRITGFPIMSTGELHRINAYLIKVKGVSLEDVDSVMGYLESLKIENWIEENRIRFAIDGVTIEDVKNDLTDEELIYSTRNKYVCEFFSQYFTNNVESEKTIIVEGHGISNGTFKDAYIKFFCEADVSTRARRRSEQTGQNYEKVLCDIKQRDESDTKRLINPVFKSDDMVIVNSEDNDVASCVNTILEVIMMKKYIIADTKIRKRAEEMGFTIRKVDSTKRADFESQIPKNDSLLFMTYYLVTKNKCLLGNGGKVFKEVFPRLKRIKKDLLKDIEMSDLVRYEFVIEVSEENYEGDCYPKEEINSYGDSLIKIEDLVSSNHYYKELAQKFPIVYGVKTNNGTVIGPDAGLIYGVNYIADVLLKDKIRIAEIGAGTCSTPISIAEKKEINYYYGVDFSSKMKENYNNIFKKLLDEKQIKSDFVISDAETCDLPDDIDIFVVGIYYEAQYDFIAARGEDIKRSMNDNGMLILQSGLPENLMFSDMLITEKNNMWPWQTEKANLKKYFAYIAQINFEEEIVTVATNNDKQFKAFLSNVIMKHRVFTIIY